MLLIHVMLGTVQVYVQAGEFALAIKETNRAYLLCSRMKGRKAQLMRAHLVQIRERVIKCQAVRS